MGERRCAARCWLFCFLSWWRWPDAKFRRDLRTPAPIITLVIGVPSETLISIIRRVGAFPVTGICSIIPETCACRLFDGDRPGHPGPIVVGADQLVAAGFFRHEGQVLRLAGLDDDLGLVGVQHCGIAQLDRLEEGG